MLAPHQINEIIVTQYRLMLHIRKGVAYTVFETIKKELLILNPTTRCREDHLTIDKIFRVGYPHIPRQTAPAISTDILPLFMIRQTMKPFDPYGIQMHVAR